MQSFIRYLLSTPGKVIRYGQFILAIAIFFFAALMPSTGAPSTLPNGFLHFFGNAALMGSAFMALFHLLRNTPIVLICASMSLVSELAQSLTDTRVTDPNDLIYNVLGLATAYIACRFIRNFLRKYLDGADGEI